MTQWNRADVRAGWIDARRGPRPAWRGALCGATDYRAGYLAAMVARALRRGR